LPVVVAGDGNQLGEWSTEDSYLASDRAAASITPQTCSMDGNALKRLNLGTKMESSQTLKKNMEFALASGMALLWVGSVCGQTNIPVFVPDNVSIYKVPLVCPAAPQIGCGSRAKPILLAFEHQGVVESAWLNHAGTLLAVVWKADTGRKERSHTVKTVSINQGIDARELKGKERKESLADFFGGSWLRGSDVDRLSAEEAGILAGRLLRKIRGVVPVTEERAKILRDQFAETLKRRLTGELTDRDST
jgi:hypothetical protein